MEHKAHIEVAKPPGTPAKEKGDLLEELAADLLRIQNYDVTEQLRLTATELDLLCEHQVNRKTVYVECKAHRGPISADVLTKLLGTLELKGYQAIGRFVNQKFERNWSDSSEIRVGNALLQWASWVKKGIEQKRIPKPPGRIKTEPENQLRLFQMGESTHTL